jgi:hypothetical protein
MQPSSDVFSAGILLWELVALQRFWNHLPEYEVRRRLVGFDIPDISRLKPQVGGELGRICRQALAPDPARRYASAVEFATELERFLLERSAVAAPASIARVMANACGALQQEARRVLEDALESPTTSGRRRESLTEAGLWQVLTRERPLPSSTAAVWVAGTLAALLIAIGAQRLRSAAPDASDSEPVSLESVVLEPVSREVLSLDAASLDAPPAASPVAVSAPAMSGRSPEPRSSTTRIQTLSLEPTPARRAPARAKLALERSEPVPERRRLVAADARARRARRPGESTPARASTDGAATPREASPLTIRRER